MHTLSVMRVSEKEIIEVNQNSCAWTRFECLLLLLMLFVPAFGTVKISAARPELRLRSGPPKEEKSVWSSNNFPFV